MKEETQPTADAATGRDWSTSFLLSSSSSSSDGTLCVLLPHLLLLLLLLLLPLAIFSRVTDLASVAPARLREADRGVYLAGFCRAGAATPAESNC